MLLKHIADGFTLASIFVGLWAAWLWWQSSKIIIPERIAPFTPGNSTGDPQFEMVGETFATTETLRRVGNAVREASTISGEAARWTAVSSLAQFIALILGRIA